MAETTLQKREDGNGVATAEVTRGLTYTPRVDILETEDELLLFADMPGVREGEVDIRFENGELTLHARVAAIPENPRTFLNEYGVGDYFRTLTINEEIDPGKISADYKQGVLTVKLPKREEVKPRRISISAG